MTPARLALARRHRRFTRTRDEAMLQRALAMSMDSGEPAAPAPGGQPQARDLGSMTEEEQIAYAMQVRNIYSNLHVYLV